MNLLQMVSHQRKQKKKTKEKVTKKQENMAQKAHEAIRPTKIEKMNIKEGGKDWFTRNKVV